MLRSTTATNAAHAAERDSLCPTPPELPQAASPGRTGKLALLAPPKNNMANEDQSLI